MFSLQMGICPYSLMHINPVYGYCPASIYPAPTVISKAQAGLNNYQRLLWEQHVVWTRLTILSIVFGLPDVDLVTKRLLRNPKDFATVLKPLYGEQAAAGFSDLFTNHLVIAAELVKAAKAGDTRAAADTEKRWYANADEIAAFLTRINPYWSEQEWKAMLHQHLALTKSEAVNMLTGKYGEGITIFDQIEKQALEMADVMTYGIIKQFPNKFI
ncbi:MAG: hypothetical protein BWY74_02635 [Firmicutes bacterium ADurb.Bin419]|nr:MAG: hypothetical protein BWY74_02635 [Firmicutes bacterium ADurb.Bin419]